MERAVEGTRCRCAGVPNSSACLARARPSTTLLPPIPLHSTGPSASDRLLARAEEGSTAAASVVQGAWARALAGVQAAAGGAAAAGSAIGR